MSDWSTVTEFEKKIAEFFGAPFAIATDSCTSAVELCLRYKKTTYMFSPRRTYLSIPFLADKMKLHLYWTDEEWKDYYEVLHGVYDAAVLWKPDSYLPGTLMCISFQYQKHLSLGRAGMLLCDDKNTAAQLKRMSYDGRIPGIPWREQDIDTVGYHYYCTPETAELGLKKLPEAIRTEPRQWVFCDWPDLTQMKIFKQK